MILVLNMIIKRNAVALVTVLVFVILISMIAATSVFLMTNQARLVEKQVRRIKAFYSIQAAEVKAMDDISAAVPPTNLLINDQAVAVIYVQSSVLDQPGQLNATVDFSLY